jgi:hypothetical protein
MARQQHGHKQYLSINRCGKAGTNVTSIGITVRVRTRSNVPLCTLDVRPIRRVVLRRRKAPGMKSNQVILCDLARIDYPTLPRPTMRRV